jgi:hypothetical protein
MSGFLATFTPSQQIEAIYIGYFLRAADGGGATYWNNDYTALLSHGLSPTDAAVSIANSFAVQPEATAIYPFLASPPALFDPTNQTQIDGVDGFI